MRVLRLPVPGNTKISNPGISLSIEQDVLRLDIPVDDVALMKMVESLNETSDKEF